MRYAYCALRATGWREGKALPDYGTAKAVPPSGLHVSEDSP
jgi:hypothetical protein